MKKKSTAAENTEVVGIVSESDTAEAAAAEESTSEHSAKTAEAEKENTPEKYIYLGASLPDHSLKENTVFDGTFEEICLFLQAEITKYPLIKELLVPVERLAETGAGKRISGLKKELTKSFERGN